MLARRLTTILPAMRLADALETTRLLRVASSTGARTARPFHAPRHTISDVGLIGGAPRRCREKSHLYITTYSFWMNCRSAAATAWRSCANRWRTAAFEDNLPHVLDLAAPAAITTKGVTDPPSRATRS
jgi:Magnesium chelatase, subunit ChlI